MPRWNRGKTGTDMPGKVIDTYYSEHVKQDIIDNQ
jgi:hypothetical protein